MDFAKKSCKPCEGGVKPYTAAEAQKHLKDVPGWTLNDGKLHREFEFKDFVDASSWLERVKFLAESEGHHPDIHWYWNRITLELVTHAIDGLSENDFILAAKVNRLA